MPVRWEPWSLRKALAFLRMFERALAPTYHVALGGSVLIHGSSDNDLDVVVYPHSSHHFVIEEVRAAARKLGMELLANHERVQAQWRAMGRGDQKMVEVWHYGDHRVDIFLLGIPTSPG